MSNNWEYSSYSKIDPVVKKHFPFKKARKNQLETISEIKYAIDKGYKYIVLEAGTGTGKSVMAATLASIYNSSYILTVTKQLQEQYLNDFKDLGFKVVKGRGNFICKKYIEDNITLTCDEGRCVLEGYNCEMSFKRNPNQKFSKSTICPYEYQKLRAVNSNVVIANYPYMFLELNFNQDFNHRQLLICDEAHNLENNIMNQLKLEFTRKELKDYVGIKLSKSTIKRLTDGDYKDWIGFIERVLDNYSNEYNRIKNIKFNKKIKERVTFLYRRINDCKRFIYQIKHDPQMWIFDYNSRFGIVEFKPLKVNKYAKSYLLNHADVCIFMSATILDYELFGQWLGIDKNEIYPIRQKSPFKVDRNPIKTYNEFDMSYNNLKNTAPQTIDVIKKILEEHKNEKGIIHTISHSCKNYLVKNLNNDRLIDHNTANRSQQLEKFKKSEKPLILISPSMNEGVDLPGDLCRFQIIYKIPFPSLGDKQTKMRKELDKSWYDYKTSLSLVQTYGRGMRYERDYCRTYFIDSRLTSFIQRDEQTNNFIPNSFKEAINIKPAVISKEDKTYKPHLNTTIVNNAPDEPKDNVKIKMDIIEEGILLMNGGQINASISFYNDLIKHELFINDYYPYKMLSKIYRYYSQPQNEADIIIKFFKSGIYCNGKQQRWFKRRLKQLSKKGIYDFSKINELENEFKNKSLKNKNLVNTPVPTAFNLINEMPSEEPIPQEVTCESTGDKLSIKKELINKGEYLVNTGKYLKAIDFYNDLIKHELFINDYYPYKMLSKIYRNDLQPQNEADIIIKFFKSGIYCNGKQQRWFKRRLKQLSKKGIYDFSKINELENEFKNKSLKNKEVVDVPVFTAEKIKNM